MSMNNDVIRTLIKYTGNNDFVYDSKSKKWLSYHDVWSRAYIIADYITSENKKYVIAVMDNGINLFTLYFANMLARTIIVPIDPQKSAKEINGIVNEYSDYLLLDEQSDLFTNLNDIVAEENVLEKIYQIDAEKIFMITYTSGSTGHAKGVIHSLQNLVLAANSLGKITGLNEHYTMCHVMPMTYMAGILNTIILPLVFGAKIVLLPRFSVISAVKFWSNVEKLGITAFWLSPTMLNLLMTVDKKATVKKYLVQRKTIFYIGTAPLLSATRESFENKYGVKLLQNYGLSETLFISSEVPDEENPADSVGKILPEVRVINIERDELAIAAPWLFLGYTNENTADYFIADSYKTGDTGLIEQGRLTITGRIKDLIIKGGMNISPVQIEKCLAAYEGIDECAVAGITIRNEENIVCWYVLRPKAKLAAAEINNFIERELGKFCRIDIFQQVDSIPKNINGKIDKIRLVREFYSDTEV